MKYIFIKCPFSTTSLTSITTYVWPTEAGLNHWVSNIILKIFDIYKKRDGYFYFKGQKFFLSTLPSLTALDYYSFLMSVGTNLCIHLVDSALPYDLQYYSTSSIKSYVDANFTIFPANNYTNDVVYAGNTGYLDTINFASFNQSQVAYIQGEPLQQLNLKLGYDLYSNPNQIPFTTATGPVYNITSFTGNQIIFYFDVNPTQSFVAKIFATSTVGYNSGVYVEEVLFTEFNSKYYLMNMTRFYNQTSVALTFLNAAGTIRLPGINLIKLFTAIRPIIGNNIAMPQFNPTIMSQNDFFTCRVRKLVDLDIVITNTSNVTDATSYIVTSLNSALFSQYINDPTKTLFFGELIDTGLQQNNFTSVWNIWSYLAPPQVTSQMATFNYSEALPSYIVGQNNAPTWTDYKAYVATNNTVPGNPVWFLFNYNSTPAGVFVRTPLGTSSFYCMGLNDYQNNAVSTLSCEKDMALSFWPVGNTADGFNINNLNTTIASLPTAVKLNFFTGGFGLASSYWTTGDAASYDNHCQALQSLYYGPTTKTIKIFDDNPMSVKLIMRKDYVNFENFYNFNNPVLYSLYYPVNNSQLSTPITYELADFITKQHYRHMKISASAYFFQNSATPGYKLILSTDLVKTLDDKNIVAHLNSDDQSVSFLLPFQKRFTIYPQIFYNNPPSVNFNFYIILTFHN